MTRQTPFLISKSIDYLRLLPAMARLPRPLAYRFARARGRWYARHWPTVRSRIIRNAQAVLSLTDWEAEALALRIFENHSVEELEANLLYRMRGPELDHLAEFEGVQHLDAAVARGCGAILLFSHFGSFPVAGALLGFRGYPIQPIAGPYGPPHTDPVDTFHINRKVAAIQRFSRIPFAFVGERIDARAILNEGRVLAIALDASLGSSSRLDVTFLGRLTSLPYSFIRLAKLTGAPVVSFWTIRQTDGRRSTIRFEPLELPSGSSRLDFQEGLQNAADRHDRFIRDYPDHWFHIDTPASWAHLDRMWAPCPAAECEPSAREEQRSEGPGLA